MSVVHWYDDSTNTFTEPGEARWWWTGGSGYQDGYVDVYEGSAGWVQVHEQWLPLGDGYGFGVYGDGSYGY